MDLILIMPIKLLMMICPEILVYLTNMVTTGFLSSAM